MQKAEQNILQMHNSKEIKLKCKKPDLNDRRQNERRWDERRQDKHRRDEQRRDERRRDEQRRNESRWNESRQDESRRKERKRGTKDSSTNTIRNYRAYTLHGSDMDEESNASGTTGLTGDYEEQN
jgi:hypothetical protein